MITLSQVFTIIGICLEGVSIYVTLNQFPQSLEEWAMTNLMEKESILPLKGYDETKRDLRIINGVLVLGLLFQVFALFV